jgi:hypothetical protein
MNPAPNVSYIDIHVPYTASEQEFLRLAVQAAARKFRELRAESKSSHRPSGAEMIATLRQAG